MEQVIFRMIKDEKKDMKVRATNLGFSIQDYLNELIRLDREKDLVKSIS